MPVVSQLPIGQNVSLIRGLSEQSRSLEALRNQLGLAVVPGNNQIFPGDTGPPYPWYPVVNGPAVTRYVGESGAVLAVFGADLGAGSYYLNFRVGISVDGANPVDHGFVDANIVYGGNLNGIVNLTPGWHQFTVSVQNLPGDIANNYVDSAWLMIWPI